MNAFTEPRRRSDQHNRGNREVMQRLATRLVVLLMTVSTSPNIVPDGVVYHRLLVRKFGPYLAVAISTAVGILSALLLIGSTSAMRGIPGFILAIVAIPTLPLFGVPVMGGTVRWLLAILSSGLLWAFVGHVAAQRSTNRTISSWPEWRREWTRLSVGVWVGAMFGLAVAAIALGINPISM
jgi:hypothetical protein